MRKFSCLVLSCILLFQLSFAAGGDSSDPVVTLSHLNNIIANAIEEIVAAKVNYKIPTSDVELETRKTEALEGISEAGLIRAAADRVLESLQTQGKYFYNTRGMTLIRLQRDEVISGTAGTQLFLRQGSAKVVTAPLINLTAGTAAAKDGAVAQNTRYMLQGRDGSGFQITSSSAIVGVDGLYRIYSVAYRPQYTDLAQALKTMGLVRGGTTGFELGRRGTRAESVAMLARLLGEEEAALQKNFTLPFTDVPDWAEGYVGQAYTQGYTKGTSATRFSPDGTVSANQYMTFLLRALGYADGAGDFSWDQAIPAAEKLGVITPGERQMLESGVCYRDQLFYLSYYTLFAHRKGSEQTLLDYLIERGAVAQSDVDRAQKLITTTRK